MTGTVVPWVCSPRRAAESSFVTKIVICDEEEGVRIALDSDTGSRAGGGEAVDGT
jgi:hypothetical protein